MTKNPKKQRKAWVNKVIEQTEVRGDKPEQADSNQPVKYAHMQ
ncbi:hypothetical protein [Rothia dentocariosa]|nr:hypothetical protein [Rothia dentocariosa]